MNELGDLLSTVPGFTSLAHNDKIKLFAWFLHSARGKERFNQADIRACYASLCLAQPANVSTYLTRLTEGGSKKLLRDSRGFFLERRVRDELQVKYGRRESAVVIDKLLRDLPAKVANLNERGFLGEVLVCFEHGAFRASIVMCWNLTYSHVLDWILAKHLAAFNAQLPVSFPKKNARPITDFEGFAELKEAEVLQVARSAKLTSVNVNKILGEKLTRRNLAAHPANQAITRLQAEECIHDLVENVLLVLPW